MASALFDKGRERFLLGQINWAGDDIKACLVDTGAYTVSLVNHEFLADVAPAAILSTSANFSGKTTAAGAADAADVTFTAVSGPTAEAVIIYKDTGVGATSPLIAYLDSGTGLPITPNSGDIIVTWDNGINKIFRL